MDGTDRIGARLLGVGATAVLFAGTLFVSSVSLSQTLHYGASSGLNAVEPLSWVQETQALCLREQGAYCSTFEALLELRTDGEARSKLLQQLEDSTHDGAGAGYVYRLDATPETFKATASCCSGLDRGADVWQVGPEGEPTAVQQSSTRAGLAPVALLRPALLLTLILHLGMMGSTAWRWWRRRPSLARAMGSVLFVLFGTLVPAVLSLILAS